MINLSPRAADALKRILAENNDKDYRLRLQVFRQAQLGLSCRMMLDDELAEDDVHFEKEGVPIVIDPASIPYLEGADIDFVEDGTDRGFIIHRPGPASQCGCGAHGHNEASSGCGCG